MVSFRVFWGVGYRALESLVRVGYNFAYAKLLNNFIKTNPFSVYFKELQ